MADPKSITRTEQINNRVVFNNGATGAGGGGIGIQDIIAGDNIDIDKTDPEYPIISATAEPITIEDAGDSVTGGVSLINSGSDGEYKFSKLIAGDNLNIEYGEDHDATALIISATGGGGGGIESIVAGGGIEVDTTDPDNPIVNANNLTQGYYIPSAWDADPITLIEHNIVRMDPNAEDGLYLALPNDGSSLGYVTVFSADSPQDGLYIMLGETYTEEPSGYINMADSTVVIIIWNSLDSVWEKAVPVSGGAGIRPRVRVNVDNLWTPCTVTPTSFASGGSAEFEGSYLIDGPIMYYSFWTDSSNETAFKTLPAGSRSWLLSNISQQAAYESNGGVGFGFTTGVGGSTLFLSKSSEPFGVPVVAPGGFPGYFGTFAFILPEIIDDDIDRLYLTGWVLLY